MSESLAHTSGDLTAAFAFRAELLGAARTRVLTGDELVQASRLIYGRPEWLSVYGVPAPQMTGRGLRLLGRTTIECSVDGHCADFAEAFAARLNDEPQMTPGFVADLFCGSGNLGWHLGKRLNLPLAAVKTRLHRARHRFAEELERQTPVASSPLRPAAFTGGFDA